MSATLLLVARDGVTALAAQLCAIAALPDTATVVIVDDAARPEVSALLGELEGVILDSLRAPARTPRGARARGPARAGRGVHRAVAAGTAGRRLDRGACRGREGRSDAGCTGHRDRRG